MGASPRMAEIRREALEWSRELYLVDPRQYANNLVIQLGDCGEVLYNIGSWSAACEVQSELVKVVRELYVEAPDTYSGEMRHYLARYGASLSMFWV